MTNKEREKEISKQPTKEECIAFFKELTKLADARFVPYYKMAIEALETEPCEEQEIYGKAYKEGYDKGWSDGNFIGQTDEF